MTKRRIQIPHITVDNPDLQLFIDAVVHNEEINSGKHGVSNKRPTVEDLTDANVTNAEDIT